MSKGQTSGKRIKKFLKFFKLNENTISTLMGGVVIIVIAGLIFNYFRTNNLKTLQGTLLTEQEATSISKQEELNGDKIIATHKVVKGEDLWHIAERYYKSGYNYVDIMSENKISGKGVIVAGQELRIPKVEAKKITVVEKKDTVKIESKTLTSISTGEYTTQKGDSYWNIAVRAYGDGYQWTKIYEANKKIFANPNIIYSGVKISIPALK